VDAESGASEQIARFLNAGGCGNHEAKCAKASDCAVDGESLYQSGGDPQKVEDDPGLTSPEKPAEEVNREARTESSALLKDAIEHREELFAARNSSARQCSRPALVHRPYDRLEGGAERFSNEDHDRDECRGCSKRKGDPTDQAGVRRENEKGQDAPHDIGYLRRHFTQSVDGRRYRSAKGSRAVGTQCSQTQENRERLNAEGVAEQATDDESSNWREGRVTRGERPGESKEADDWNVQQHEQDQSAESKTLDCVGDSEEARVGHRGAGGRDAEDK